MRHSHIINLFITVLLILNDFFLGITSHSQTKKVEIDSSRLETLWMYGDSQAERLYWSIKDGPLCKEIFKSCNLSKMWVYPYHEQVPPWDDKDYDDNIILDSLREVLGRPEMNDNSVMILNLGLHYMESTTLQDYQLLIKKVIDLLKERDKETSELKYKTRVIWKTTTSISKEKDTADQLKSDRRRFLSLPVSIYIMSTRSLIELRVIMGLTRGGVLKPLSHATKAETYLLIGVVKCTPALGFPLTNTHSILGCTCTSSSGACFFHNKPMQRQFYRPDIFPAK